MPGDHRFLMLSSSVFAKSTSFWPPTRCDTDWISPFTRSRIRTVIGLAMIDPRYLLMAPTLGARSEEHTSELQSRLHLVCRLLLEKKKTRTPKNSAASTGGSAPGAC